MMLSRAASFLSKRLAGTTKSALMLGGGTILGQVFILAATPFLARMYPPEAFGSFGVVLSFIAFAGVATMLRLDMAIMATDSVSEAADLLRLCLKLAAFGSALAAFTFAILVTYSIGPFGNLHAWSPLLVFGVLIFVSTVSVTRFYLIKQAEFGLVGLNSAIQGATRATAALALGLLVTSWIGLLLAEMLSRAVSATLLLARCKLPSADKRNHWKTLLRKYRRYPAILLPSSALDALGHALTQPLVVVTYGVANGGLFLLAVQIVSIPAALVSAAFSDVIHGYAARLAPSDARSWRQLFFRFARTLGLISVAIYLPLGFLMWFAGSIILGPQWRTTEILIPLLCVSAAVASVASPLSRIIVVRDRQELKFMTDTIGLIVPNGVVLAAYFMQFSFQSAIVALASAQFVCSGVYLFFSWHVANLPEKEPMC